MIGHESFQVVHLESLGLLGRVPAARIPMAAWSQVGIRNLSLHRHKKHSTRSVWKGQSASIWVYLSFEAQANHHQVQKLVKIMSLPATCLQVTAHGFRTWTRFWPLRLNGTSCEAWWVQKCASDQAQQSVWNWDVVLEDFPHCVQGFI